jgi:hypothetical protein
MTSTQRDTTALARFSQAFSACVRPAHFTNFAHCDECAEHDRTLQLRTPDTLAIGDVGNPGWDPICAISPDGFAYYLPGLARLVLDDCTAVWYGSQFFSHLIWDGPGNARFLHCSRQQRCAVADFIAHLIDTRADRIGVEGLGDHALRALEIWNEHDAPSEHR